MEWRIVTAMSQRHTDARHFVGREVTAWEAWGVSWQVEIDWITDESGKAVPVRLALNGAPYAAYDDESILDLPCTTEPIGVIRREVLERLPLRELLDHSREVMITSGKIELPCVDPDAFVDTSTHVGRLRRAALLHAQYVESGSRNPSQDTRDALDREGVRPGRIGSSDPADVVLTVGRVRTWITEARKRGLYPGEEGSK
ncbi:hypothetical protein [Nocardioides sp. MH1]|uniref:hypothetical protein n=1 Tax=Nocardioides sp. MH1 TaxID=3242490 RepID=UPI0035230233